MAKRNKTIIFSHIFDDLINFRFPRKVRRHVSDSFIVFMTKCRSLENIPTLKDPRNNLINIRESFGDD